MSEATITADTENHLADIVTRDFVRLLQASQVNVFVQEFHGDDGMVQHAADLLNMRVENAHTAYGVGTWAQYGCKLMPKVQVEVMPLEQSEPLVAAAIHFGPDRRGRKITV